MDCPHCGTPIQLSDDPTQRMATCGECGREVDLAEAMSGTGEVTGVAGMASEGLVVDRDDRIGRTLGGGRYRIDSPLGEGGMGKVYLGTQLNLSRRVAIKILSAELTGDSHFARRFEREAGVLAGLDHNHIVTVHDLGIEDELHYIVMAYVSGPEGGPLTLQDLMDAGPLDEDLTLRVVSQVCDALRYAHERGIIHRDIKPANILIDEEGNAKLADFGIARIAGSALPEMTMTTPGTVMGTLRYMAPEQKSDATMADARSDLYSLGAVFYEMLTGHSPEGRFDLPSRLKRSLDPRVDRIVDRALKSAVDRRYQNATEMARDISTISTEKEYGKLRGGGPPVKGPPPPPIPVRPAAPARRGTPKVGILVGAALLLVAVIVLIVVASVNGDRGKHSVALGEDVLDLREVIKNTLSDGDEVDLVLLEEARDLLGRKGAPLAEDATRAVLANLQAGNGGEVAGQIPDALMPAIREGYGMSRADLAEQMSNMRHGQQSRIVTSQTLGDGWALVHYQYLDGGNRVVFETVAVAVREDGRWKVVP